MTIKSVREVNSKSMHEASYLTHKLVQWSYITQALLKYKQPLKVFRGKGVLKINSKFTGEHPC